MGETVRFSNLIPAVGMALVFSAGVASAHPHVFADGHVVLETDAHHQLVAVTNIWKFDAPFSSFAVQGLDKNHDGKLSHAELMPLAHTSMESLKDYHFFTWAVSGAKQAEFDDPRDYSYRFEKGRLILTFTMPLKTPFALDKDLKVEVFDPEYFVAYTFPKHGAVKIGGDAAKNCTANYIPPKPLSASIIAQLAAVPADQHDLPEALKDAAAGLAHLFTVDCH